MEAYTKFETISFYLKELDLQKWVEKVLINKFCFLIKFYDFIWCFTLPELSAYNQKSAVTIAVAAGGQDQKIISPPCINGKIIIRVIYVIGSISIISFFIFKVELCNLKVSFFSFINLTSWSLIRL